MSEAQPQPTGLEFPCDYPLKAMGRSGGAFREAVVRIITDHVGPIAETQVRERLSSAGKFQSVTVTVRVDTREQLEAIYRSLSECDQVLWTL